jgi:hypothetical protein
MYLSGAILVSATVAGRLSSRVPVRLLIGPGLIIIGVSLLRCAGSMRARPGPISFRE